MKLSTSTRHFLLRYNTKAYIPPVALRYLTLPAHPLRPKIAHMYATRDSKTLWWRVTIGQPLKLKRVVRSWSARRTRMAFREAMKEHGLDHEGRRIADTAQDESKCGKYEDTGFLTGSLEIVVQPESIKENFGTVQQEVKRLLDDLIRQRSQRLQHQGSGYQQKHKIQREGKTDTLAERKDV